MPLLTFTEPRHVKMIWKGLKPQTTRIPRKKQVKEGDLLYCYYKSRAAKTCKNCINRICDTSVIGNQNALPGATCALHTNFIGVATALRINRDVIFQNESQEFKEAWAILDGFVDFTEADAWFQKAHGTDWQEKPLDVISFEGHWLRSPSLENCVKCRHYSEPPAYIVSLESDHMCEMAEAALRSLGSCPLKMEV